MLYIYIYIKSEGGDTLKGDRFIKNTADKHLTQANLPIENGNVEKKSAIGCYHEMVYV